MGKQEFDMEVTPERVEDMKKTLLRLWAHQNGAEVKDVVLTVTKKPTKEPA